MGALAEDIRWTIHPHPTLGETIMESADLIFGQSTHMFKPPKK
jgi:dihydrolipoamide dehydrogenase